jgi:hypothetical protein
MLHSLVVGNMVQELKGRNVCVIYDGATKVALIEAIVLRFVDPDFRIQQRLVKLGMLAKSPDAQQLARFINSTLASYGISPERIRVSISDSAAINGAAMDQLAGLWEWHLRIGCFSHCLSNAGQKLVTPELDAFMEKLSSMFNMSNTPKILWREVVGYGWIAYCDHRWWAWYEVCVALRPHWAKLPAFLSRLNEEKACPASYQFLIAHFREHDRVMAYQLALTLDIGNRFAAATYELESDGFLAPLVYEKILELSSFGATFVTNKQYPLLLEEVLKDTRGRGADATDLADAHRMAKPVVQLITPFLKYFQSHFFAADALQARQLQLFKACKLFNPMNIAVLQLEVEEQLHPIRKWFSDEQVEELKQELSKYVGKADVERESTPESIRTFWGKWRSELPAWSAAAGLAALLQPSSAGVERVFSVLRQRLSSAQNASLQDAVELSVMQGYNSNLKEED